MADDRSQSHFDGQLRARIGLAKQWIRPTVMLGLTPRTKKILDNRGVQAIGQLILFDRWELESLGGLGPATAGKIGEALERAGLTLASGEEVRALREAFGGLDFPIVTALVLLGVYNLPQLGLKTRQWVDQMLSGYPDLARRNNLRAEIDLRLEKIGRRLG